MATLEQVFQREKAWIAECDDVDALIEKIGDWRDSLREAERDGDQLVRMRAGDLVKLARSRVVRLQAGTIREEPVPAPVKEVAPKVEERRVETRSVETVPAPATRERRAGADSGAAERNARDEATRAATAKAQADARIVVAEASRMELQNELLKAQVEAARRVTVAPTVPAAARVAASAPTRAETPKPTTTPRASSAAATRVTAASVHAPGTAVALAAPPGQTPLPAAPEITREDQRALMSVGRWPPTGPALGHPFHGRVQDWPPEWTLTGLDLARFRGGIRATQRVFAAQLGVTTATIAGLEGNPGARVGPAMQIALRRAMNQQAEKERNRREEAAVARAARTVAESGPVLPSSGATPPTPSVTAPNVPVGFTGADLARLRSERKHSQRQFAAVLGVGHGMVAKAEVAAGEPLGERMRAAVGALLAIGGGGAPG